MTGPLEGIRILDLTRVVSGPFCTAMFADMGAEVINIEGPAVQDGTRLDDGTAVNGVPHFFMSLNRGKRALCVDLKNLRGRQLFLRLVRTADVVIHNFGPGAMERLELSYKDLKNINPRIIYASICGFGRSSPYEELPAYDVSVQAMGGLMSVNGHPDGPPTRAAIYLGDTAASLYTLAAVCAALVDRASSGVGQEIEVAMLDCVFSLLDVQLSIYLSGNRVPARVGSADQTIYPYDAYRAADGFFGMAAYDPAHFERLSVAIGCPDLPADERFGDQKRRWENRSELKSIIEAWSSLLPLDEVMETMRQARIPAGAVNDLQQIAESLHIQRRQMLVDVEDPVAGCVRLPAFPVKFSSTPAAIQGPAPRVGEHTDQILRELAGLNDDEIARLRSECILA